MVQARTFVALVVSIFAIIGCDGKSPLNAKLFKERAVETPAPSDETINKSFFVNPSGKPKTFLCGWAPEMVRGDYAELATLLRHEVPHCNIEFEITENFLIGKRIRTSYPNDRSRWEEIIRIPIVSHFYYEREKDQYGRDTNEFIESQRSHWSARPMMRLNLQASELTDILYDLPIKASSVRDIEWDKKRNFLGFTLTVNLWNTLFQADYRVNFLQFEHDSNFKKVPYHQENARKINILHVMGRKIEGQFPELYAARWDFSQPTTIYINNAPKNMQPVLEEVVESWNQTLRKIGAIPQQAKAFVPVQAQMKHNFDLRYTTMNWVSDPEISSTSPLGIGMAHADVKNGKILWGSVTLWGGALENYINAYAPVSVGSANLFGQNFPLNQLSPAIPREKKMAPGLEAFANMSLSDSLKKINQSLAANGDGSSVSYDVLSSILKETKESFYSSLIEESQKASQINIEDLLESQFSVAQKQGLVKTSPMEEFLSTLQKRDLRLEGEASSVMVEHELNAENLVVGLQSAAAQSLRPTSEIMRSVVRELALHEVGHMMGLGHQFKENIVPPKGSVPSSIWKDLNEKATAEKNFQNYTSVMGYRSGKVEILTSYNDVAPGPHDELVLRYLYKSEYPTYDPETDSFVYVNVPVSGRLPDVTQVRGKDLKIAYFPQCNDYDASLGVDPFCNRFDRGNKAEDLVKNYIDDLTENLGSSLFSMVGGRSSPWEAEGRLWYIGFRDLGRVRLFYDEMRRRLRLDPALAPLWEQVRRDTNSLFEFSSACQTDNESSIRSAVLKELFQYEDIRDLCRANANAINGYKFLLNLSMADFTKLDISQRYRSGGYLAGDASRDYGNTLGTWYQLSNLPLKMSALYTMTTAVPVSLGQRGLVENPFYSDKEDKYLYRTLYPREFTRTIADTAKSNLRFEITGKDNSTTIGKTILAASWMVPYQTYFSNDTAALPRSYTDTLNSQSQFQIGMAAVLVNFEQGDGMEPDHYNKISATVYDFMTNKEAAARDIYVLPRGEFLIRVNGMFLYPVTKLKFYGDGKAYAMVYKVGYDFEVEDRLLEDSIKFSLTEIHEQIISKCVEGFSGNGLQNYFQGGNKAFKGFYIPPGMFMESGKEKLTNFYQSITDEFSEYEKWAQEKSKGQRMANQKMVAVCDEAIRGVGQILTTGALVSGYWLPITYPYLVK